jgi:hypothetical protein
MTALPTSSPLLDGSGSTGGSHVSYVERPAVEGQLAGPDEAHELEVR